jgi:hypothetical protein
MTAPKGKTTFKEPKKAKNPQSLVFQGIAGLFHAGADDGNRTHDLILTKDVLYRLSYISVGNVDIINDTRG